jgi:hypothetical protein
MSEPAAKQRQMINLDEFERRLGRPIGPSKSGEDPLAELARLVGDTEDRFKGAFQTRPAAPASAEPRYNSDYRAPRAGAANGGASRTARLGGDFAAIEAGLRGSIAPEFHAAPAADFRAAPAAYSEPEDEDWFETPFVAQTQAHNIEPPRSRLPLYATAAIIVLGMAGIGGSFALKRSSLAPHEIAMIKAADGPIKIQASDTGDVAKPAQDASILDKSPPPAPLAVVNRSEEPVNLGPAPQAPAQALANEMQPASAAPSSAAVVPVPAPPALDTQSQSFGLAGMIEPKKVKTVAVRPDGTIVSGDAPQQQQGLPTISPVVTPPPALGAPSPAEAATSSDTTGSLPTTAGSIPPSRDSAAVGSDVSAEHPPAADKSEMPRAHAKPEKIADADVGATDVAPQPAGRPHGFAVQLAAPQTEAEARQTMAKLQKKFASELGSYHLKYRLASVADKSVYRVRVVGLSHEEAVTLCQQVQAKGGNCFVAKN